MYLSTVFLFLIFLTSSTPVLAGKISLSVVDEQDFYSVQVNLTGLERTDCKSQSCYLQAIFTQSLDTPRYFGYTLGQNDWFAYQSKPDPGFIKSAFPSFEINQEGSWSGVIRIAIDEKSPLYKGSGPYYLLVRRYNGVTSNHATDEITPLVLNHLSSSSPTPTPTTIVSPTVQAPKPTATSIVSVTPSNHSSSPTPSVVQVLSVTPTVSSSPVPSVASSSTATSVLATSSSSATAIVTPSKSADRVIDSSDQSFFSLFHLGGLLIALSSSILLFRSLKSNDV